MVDATSSIERMSSTSGSGHSTGCGRAQAGSTSNAKDLARMIENTEALAYVDMLSVAPREWGCITEETRSGWFLFAPTLDMLLFNRLVGCGLDSPANRGEVEKNLARYRQAGVRNFGVQVSPAAEPPELKQWLTDDGLERRDNWSKVYRAAGEVPHIETDLRIEEIGREHAGAFGAIACAAFGMPKQLESWIAAMVGLPNWHQYLAFDGATPVAAAALMVQGDVGWLGVAGTLSSARKRGGQSALMERRLNDGRALGCRWFVTETGEDTAERPNPSYHNMVRAGFSLAYQRPNYISK